MGAEEFQTQYLPLSESLYRVAFHMLESEADAEDAVQDLYLRLWDSRDILDTVHNPKAYCLTLIRNACLDRLRRQKVKTTDIMSEAIVSDEKDSLYRLTKKEELSRVMKILDSLPERQRQVLKLRVFDGLPYNEISRKTGMNQLTLRVLLSNARKRIKQTI